MKSLKRLWMPVLLGVLLICTVVGVASARPNARPQQQAWRVLTVGGHACIPAFPDDDWYHNGSYAMCGIPDAGGCVFTCPLDFPAAGEQAVGAVNVKRFTMHAYDNEVGKDIEAWMYKLHPSTAAQVPMAYVTTGGTSSVNPQQVVDTSIQYNPVYRVHSPYVWLVIYTSGGVGMVYGFWIHYTW